MKNLLFRLRRICNHPLLYRGYYSADVIEVRLFSMLHFQAFFETKLLLLSQKLAQLYHKESLREGKPQPLERLQHDIQTTWSDYDVHKVNSFSSSKSKCCKTVDSTCFQTCTAVCAAAKRPDV